MSQNFIFFQTLPLRDKKFHCIQKNIRNLKRVVLMFISSHHAKIFFSKFSKNTQKMYSLEIFPIKKGFKFFSFIRSIIFTPLSIPRKKNSSPVIYALKNVLNTINFRTTKLFKFKFVVSQFFRTLEFQIPQAEDGKKNKFWRKIFQDSYT